MATLQDLNDHLFSQLGRLGSEELKGDALTEEIERAKSVTSVSKEIISTAALTLDAMKLHSEFHGVPKDATSKLIGKSSS